jgi:hypothetical protein
MTRDELNAKWAALKSYERDAWVASNVMGIAVTGYAACWAPDGHWGVVPGEFDLSTASIDEDGYWQLPNGMGTVRPVTDPGTDNELVVPAYTLEVADAWAVLEKTQSWRFSQRQEFYGHLADMVTTHDSGRRIAWPDALGFMALRGSFPESVCKAALLAVPDTQASILV